MTAKIKRPQRFDAFRDGEVMGESAVEDRHPAPMQAGC